MAVLISLSFHSFQIEIFVEDFQLLYHQLIFYFATHDEVGTWVKKVENLEVME